MTSKDIISGSYGNTIEIWRISDETLFHRFEEAHFKEIRSVAVTSDNKYIISGSWDKTIGIWSISDKTLIHRFEEAHSDKIASVTDYANKLRNSRRAKMSLKLPQEVFFWLSKAFCCSYNARKITTRI